MSSRAARGAESSTHSTFVAIVFAALLASTLLLAVSAEAQSVANTQYKDDNPEQEVQGSGQQAQTEADEEDDKQATTRATDPLAGATATSENRTSNGNGKARVDLITIEAADCTVQPTATVIVEIGNAQVEISNSQNDITASDEQVTITGPDDGDILADNIKNIAVNTGSVVSSTGITCGRDAGSNNAGDDENDNNTENDATDDTSRTADDSRDLSCEELLAQFRAEGSSGQQYGDASNFSDADVRAQIEVCLEEEVVQGTAAEGDLPDTGGVSLVGLAVLGLVSAAAGFSVIRGGRRRG